MPEPSLRIPRISGPVMGQRPEGGAASPNPNLLLWSEALDNPVWVASGAVVTANAADDPAEQPTAEHVAFDPEGALSQSTSVAATTGDPVGATKPANATVTRFDISGTFDGLTYQFSVYAKGADTSFSMSLFRAGGVIVARLANPDDGGGIEVDFAWAKLETPTLTPYVKREGT